MSSLCCFGSRPRSDSVESDSVVVPARPSRINSPLNVNVASTSEQGNACQSTKDNGSKKSQTRQVKDTCLPFTYQTRLPGRHIRLLQIEPGHDEDAICCSMVTAVLDTCQSFEALSYTWNSELKSSSICCDGTALSVTDNLFNALWQFRRLSIYGPLWVDAVCINQQDIVEKTAQVKMMFDIYSHAMGVRVWLGEEDDGISPFREKDLETFHRFDEVATRFLDRTQSFEPYPDFISIERDPKFKSDMHAVLSLLTRPWFSRMWIIQELLAAKACEFQLGPHTLDAVEIIHVAYSMQASKGKSYIMSSRPSHPLRDGTGVAPSLAELDLLYARGAQLRLSELVRRTGMFQTTEEKDKIFALVGLASDADPDFIDYDKDIRTLFIDIARNALLRPDQSEAEGLDFLSKIAAPDPDAKWVVDHGVPRALLSTDMPSWAPVLSKTDMIWGDVKPLAEIWSSSKDKCGLHAEYWIGADKTLHVRGKLLAIPKTIVMDTVHDWPLQLLEDHMSESRFTHLLAWIDAIKTLTKQTVGMEEETTEANEFQTSWYTELSRALAFSSAWTAGASKPPVSPFRYRICFHAFQYYVTIMTRGTFSDAFELAAEMANKDFKHKFSKEPGFEPITEADVITYVEAFALGSRGRKFCVTQTGDIAWVPAAARLRDFIVKLQGMRVPMLLRTDMANTVLDTGLSDDVRFKIVGDCYLHNMMFTECDDHGNKIRRESHMLVIT